MIRKLLREALSTYKQLSEIDWEKDFKDVEKTCIEPKELVDYLNRVKANASKDYGEREKFSPTLPYIHAKSSLFKKGKIDIKDFAKKITEKPNTLINLNEKMTKSGLPNEFFYKTGIPSFRGVAYDIEKGKFYYINTCPGAGTCRTICYALKGRFIQYPVSYDSMTRRLNLLLNNPEEYENRLYEEIKAKCKLHKALKDYENRVIIRWNDSGDFFTKKYVDITEKVIKKLQNEGYNIFDDAYTKVADVANKSKIGSVAFSLGGSKKELSKIDQAKNKLSMWVPKDLFADLDLQRISDKEELKKRVSKFFKLPLKDIITYNELIRIPEKIGKLKWHVLVTPDDGDDAAARRDVKTILLTIH